VGATILRFIPPPAAQGSGASDEDLVRRAQAGHAQAQALLFQRHYGSLRAYVFRLVPHDTDLEDLVQDAFVQALDNLQRLNDPAAFRAWLRGIATRVVHNRLRRRVIARKLGLLPSANDEAALAVTSQAPPDVRAELQITYRALARLRPASRLVLQLSRLEGLNHVEVAEALDISISTVKRRLATAAVEFDTALSRMAREGQEQ
jgi:RNA polymerase sigma-70 factor (ECF subfamily)